MRISDWSSDVCSSDLFRVERQVVVDDARHTRHIEPAGGHVVSHQHRELPRLEGIQGFHAIELAFVAMDGLGFHAIALKLTRQAARADFGIGKDNDLAEPARLDQMHDSRALVAAWHGIRYLGHVFGRGIARGHFDRSEEHTSELQSLMRNSYAVF